MDKSYNTLDYKYRGLRWHTLWSGSASFDSEFQYPSHHTPIDICEYVDDARDNVIKLRITLEVTSMYADDESVVRSVESVDVTDPNNPVKTFRDRPLRTKEYVLTVVADKRALDYPVQYIGGIAVVKYNSSQGGIYLQVNFNTNYVMVQEMPYNQIAFVKGTIKKVEQFY